MTHRPQQVGRHLHTLSKERGLRLLLGEAGRPRPTFNSAGLTEATMDHAIATVTEERHADLTRRGRARHRTWVKEVFAPVASPRDPFIDLLVVATDVHTWKLLRLDRRSSTAPGTKENGHEHHSVRHLGRRRRSRPRSSTSRRSAPPGPSHPPAATRPSTSSACSVTGGWAATSSRRCVASRPESWSSTASCSGRCRRLRPRVCRTWCWSTCTTRTWSAHGCAAPWASERRSRESPHEGS